MLTILSALAALAFLGVVGLLAHSALDNPPAGAAIGSTATTTITVQSGETLWDIASRIAPAGDRRVVVDEIARLNHLSRAGDVRVGQQLRVPVHAR